MKNVTIIEIAERAGVSMKTVSRVLNGEPNVRESTREKVKKVAAELNYQPNVFARSLASKRSFVVAHFHDNPSPDYLEKIYTGIHQVTRSSGYLAVMEPLTVPYTKSAGEYLARFKVDGVILSPPLSDNTALVEMLLERGIPIVRISPRNNFELSSYAYVDDTSATKAMTEHLIELGHKKIAFIAGPREHGAARKRETGFHQATEAAGLNKSECPVFQGDFSVRSGFDAAKAALANSGDVTAIVAANDDMAVGVVMAALKRGLDVPGDLSVTGFDGSRLGDIIWPQLTTVKQPVEEMAAEVTSMLLEEIVAKEHEKKAVKFDVTNLIRNTTSIVKSPS
ncbi:MAG: LacI family transcriptional regulator [Acidimicrobiales bacterium]|nr:LacI family DNA-binding transcriptional regulator [Hyphomonadaceae bacterium]RZV36314.1 MAG: LacI family transcriptional regulator [Acidimicrobiales bacterium]